MKVKIEFLIGCLIFSLVCLAVPVRADESQSYQVDAIVNGEYSKAEQKLLEVLQNKPNDPYALLNLAFVYQKSGQNAKAREVYQRILEQPQNPHAQLASGKAQRVKTIAERGIATMDAK